MADDNSKYEMKTEKKDYAFRVTFKKNGRGFAAELELSNEIGPVEAIGLLERVKFDLLRDNSPKDDFFKDEK